MATRYKSDPSNPLPVVIPAPTRAQLLAVREMIDQYNWSMTGVVRVETAVLEEQSMRAFLRRAFGPYPRPPLHRALLLRRRNRRRAFRR